MTGTVLEPVLLTRERFSRFGQVIETPGAQHFAINEGTTERYHDLCEVDVASRGGKPLVSIFRGQARPCPISITMLERHPLGSQAFVPLSGQPFLIVVAEGGSGAVPGAVHAFVSTGGRGVNYCRNVWHHPLIALGHVSDFLVIDRGGPGCNLEEFRFDRPFPVVEAVPLWV